MPVLKKPWEEFKYLKPITAWGLEERAGESAGELGVVSGVPFWHPIKHAMFATQSAATRFLQNTNTKSQFRVVKLEITIRKIGTQSNDNND